MNRETDIQHASEVAGSRTAAPRRAFHPLRSLARQVAGAIGERRGRRETEDHVTHRATADGISHGVARTAQPAQLRTAGNPWVPAAPSWHPPVTAHWFVTDGGRLELRWIPAADDCSATQSVAR